MTRIKVILVTCVVLALGGVVAAGLIGIGGPLASSQTVTSLDSQPNTSNFSFNAGSRVLLLNVTDPGNNTTTFNTVFQPDPTFAGTDHIGDLSPNTNAVSINLKVLNANGTGAMSNGGTDFFMNAKVDVNGNMAIDPGESGTVVVGSFLQLGADANAQRMDFRFALQSASGPWAARYLLPDPGYTGGAKQVHDIGLTTVLTTANPGWTAPEFGQTFTAHALKPTLGPIACTGSVGDFVWKDTNGNGIQDASEPGLNGIKVVLDGLTNYIDPTTGLPVPVHEEAVTNFYLGLPGFYHFMDLCLGQYTIHYDATTVPVGYLPSPINQGSPDKDSNPNFSITTVTPTNYTTGDQTIDFGFVPPVACTGSIGNFVWNDLNHNGLQDVGEPGLGNVTINLTGAATASAVSSPTGFYSFTGLCHGNYHVEVDATTLPAGVIPTVYHVGGGTNPTIDSDAPAADVTLATDTTAEPTIDFGYQTVCSGSIGNFVWLDTNANGIQDLGELGIPSVTVKLNGPGGMQTTSTDANGVYHFTGLCAGTYSLEIVPNVGLIPTIQHAPGSTPANDSDVPPGGGTFPVVLATDTTVTNDIDGGFVSCTGVVGDFVWQDLNGDGIQDPGEPGFPGVTVTLTRDADSTVVGNLMSDPLGAYHFTGVCPGAYHVAVVEPMGFASSPTTPPALAPSMSVDSNTNPSPITVGVGTTDNTVDFGFFPVPPQGLTTLSISKTDGTTMYTPGGSTIYSIVVSNFGPSTAVNVSVTDAKPSQITSWFWSCGAPFNGATGCTNFGPSAGNFTNTLTLPAGSSITYTVVAAISPAATGMMVNMATVMPSVEPPFNAGFLCPTGTDANGITRSFSSVTHSCTSTDIDNPPNPHLALTKTPTPSIFNGPGELITYSLVATNDGSVTLTGVTIADADPNVTLGPSCSVPSTLLVGQSKTCAATHITTQADTNAGLYTNTASASSTTPGTNTPVAQATIGRARSVPHLTITKNATEPSFNAVGDVIHYQIVATNDGDSNLASVTVFDFLVDNLTCVPASGSPLLVGASMNCTATHTVTAADIAAGHYFNQSCADDGVGGAAPACASKDVPGGRLTIAKNATETSYGMVGDVIHYQIVATNAGQSTLTNVLVTDPLVTGLSCVPGNPVASLPPGGTITCTATHTVTQADLNAGHFQNQSCVDDGPGGVSQACATKDVPAANLAITKTSIETSYGAVGDVINYQITATNIGQMTLSPVTITDPKVENLSCVPGNGSALNPGQSMLCTAAHTITAADITAGHYLNTSCVDDGPGPAASTCASKDVPLAHLSVTKTSTEQNFSTVGQLIHYTIVATNDGQIMLGLVLVSDPLVDNLVCNPFNGSSLAPGAAMTCTATHVVTQADLNAGHYFNQSCVDDGAGGAAMACASRDVPTAHLTITKAATEPSFGTVGDVIHYQIVATNDGPTALTNVTVVDPGVSGLVCNPGNGSSLAPGGSMNCTATHTIVAADIQAGHYFNQACVDDGPNGAGQACASKDVPYAHLTITKAATEPSFGAVGDVIHYQIVATNDGNVNLPAVTVSDPGVVGLSCAPPNGSALATGASMTCTATHSVTAADIAAGHYLNQACVDDGQGGAAQSCASKDVPRAHLSITKVSAEASYNAVGQVLHYTITATNDGEAPLASVTVTDPGVDNLTCNPANGSPLAQAQQMICTATHTVVQADLTAGHYLNTACADDTPSGGAPAICASKDVPSAHLSITKNATETAYNAAGNVIHYQIVATNDGPTTLNSVTVVDPGVTGLSCSPANGSSLTPGQSMSCTATHTTTATDVTAGHYMNTACVDDGPNGAQQACASKDLPAIVPLIDLEATKSFRTVCILPGRDGHNEGDHCDHESHRNGHSDGDGCDHEKDTHRHFRGDGCDHESHRNGHSDGDQCDHDRAIHHHTAGDRCDHERGTNGHRSGDGCDHEKDVVHRDRDGDDHEGHRNGHFDGDNCAHEKHLILHHTGDKCDHESGRFGHHPGDGCEHEKARTCSPVPIVGSNVAFTVTVRNNGTATATGVTVLDQLTNGFTWVSDDGAGSYNRTTGVWTVGTLLGGASRALQITVKVNANSGSTTYTNCATAKAGQQTEPDTTNNTACVQVMPPAKIDLSLTKTVRVSCLLPVNGHQEGDHCDHERRRNGHSDGDGCDHEKSTHRHYSGDRCSHEQNKPGHSDGDGCDHDRAVHHHTVGDSCDHERHRNGHSDGDGCDHEKDALHADSDSDDHEKHINGHVEGDNCAHERHLILHTDGDNCDHENGRFGHSDGDGCDHEKARTCSSIPKVGGTVVFTLTVRNETGFNTATGVKVTDKLPSGLTYVSSTASQGTYSSWTGLWTVGTLASGSSATLAITATVATAGAKTNYAQVTAADQADADSTPNNNAGPTPVEEDEAAVTVTPCTGSLSFVKKTNGTDSSKAPGVIVPVGSVVTWTYTVNNTTGVTLSNVTITDNKVDSASIHCVTAAGSNVIASLASGASATCTATGTATAGQYSNIGKVVATTPGNGTLMATNADFYTGFSVDCPNAGGRRRTSYSSKLTATGGHSTSYTFSISSGSLPDGLSLNSTTGAITGTPSTSGTSNFTVKAVDSDGHNTTKAGSIAIQ